MLKHETEGVIRCQKDQAFSWELLAHWLYQWLHQLPLLFATRLLSALLASHLVCSSKNNPLFSQLVWIMMMSSIVIRDSWICNVVLTDVCNSLFYSNNIDKLASNGNFLHSPHGASSPIFWTQVCWCKDSDIVWHPQWHINWPFKSQLGLQFHWFLSGYLSLD